MHAETMEQVHVLRSQVKEERAILENLESGFSHHSMKKWVEDAVKELDEVEALLGLLESGGRTLLQELSVVNNARIPYQNAVSSRQRLQDAMKSHGPNAQLI